jgi:CheY-like chemotaxis protein
LTPRSDKTRILLVDDRGTNRYVLSRILTNAGFAVEECATGMQALNVVRTLPDAVILDVKLPDISGYEVCRDIKTDPITKLIPVLLTSATFASEQVPPEMERVGAEGYLAHPFKPADVVEQVKRVLLPK